MYYIMAAGTGFCIAIMILQNGGMAGLYGNYAASVLIHVFGMATILAVLLGTKSKLKMRSELPWYFYLGGASGVITVLSTNISFLHLGVSLTLALGLLGQALASLAVDQFGILGMPKVPFNRKKLLGFGLILGGILAMAIL